MIPVLMKHETRGIGIGVSLKNPARGEHDGPTYIDVHTG